MLNFFMQDIFYVYLKSKNTVNEHLFAEKMQDWKDKG